MVMAEKRENGWGGRRFALDGNGQNVRFTVTLTAREVDILEGVRRNVTRNGRVLRLRSGGQDGDYGGGEDGRGEDGRAVEADGASRNGQASNATIIRLALRALAREMGLEER